MIQHLAAEVRATWDAIAPGTTVPARLHVAKWSGDAPDAESLLVFFLFAPGMPSPVAVAKASRGPTTDPCIRREFEMLHRAHARLPTALGRVVPRPLATGVVNGRSYFLATVVPGRIEPHYVLRTARARTGALGAALDWVLEAGAATRSQPIALAEWIPAVQDPETALASLGASADLRRTLAPRLAALWTSPGPAALTHGDFFAGNVLFEADRCAGVVDWTLASERGPGAHDVLTYEFSIGVAALRSGGSWSPAGRDEVAALPGFVAARRQLRDQGIDCAAGSEARLASLIASILREEALAPGRSRTRAAQFELLAIELGMR